MFDGEETTFRTIRLRPKQPKCNICGDNPSIKELIDYEQFCGALATDKVSICSISSCGFNLREANYENWNYEGSCIKEG